MATVARSEGFDNELAAWLETVRADQDEAALDQAADLWCHNHEAHGIPDKNSPAAEAVHARINDVLDGMGL